MAFFPFQIMKELLSAFSYMGIHQVASLIFGLVRTKIIAAFLGPAGMGIVSQANSYLELVKFFSSLGISDGLIKLLADFRRQRDENRLVKTIITVVLLFGFLGLVMILISSLFSATISEWIFNDTGYGWFVLVAGIGGLFAVEYTAILCIYQAMLRWAEYALVSVIGYTLNILVSTVFILWLGVWGAVFSMALAQAINVLIVLYVLRSRVLPKQFSLIWKTKPDRQSLRQLTRFIGPLSTLTIISTVSLLFIRSQVIHRLGLEANGLYQVVYAISLAYMGLIRNAFNSFGVSKATEVLDEPAKIVRLQNDELRLGFIILCPLTLFTMLTRYIWVPLLYSSDFLTAVPLLIWQLLADLVRMLRVTMNVSLIPLERFRFILVDGILDWLGWALLSSLLIPVMGVAAVPFSYLLVGVVTLIIAYIYHHKTSAYRIYKINKQLLLKGFLLVLPGIFLTQYGRGTIPQVILPILLLVIMLTWLPTRDEYHRLVSTLKEKFLTMLRPR